MIVRKADIGDVLYTAKVCRFWDIAATKPVKAGHDPDWCAGALLLLHPDGEWFLLDVRRTRDTPLQVERFLARTALLDDEWLRHPVAIRAEQEGGSESIIALDMLGRTTFLGRDFAARRPDGSKKERANPLARAAEAGHVHLLEAEWNNDWLDEIESFPDGAHDDMVDATSGAFNELAPKPSAKATDFETLEKQNEWGAL